jgi:hypothetical protein
MILNSTLSILKTSARNIERIESCHWGSLCLCWRGNKRHIERRIPWSSCRIKKYISGGDHVVTSITKAETTAVCKPSASHLPGWNWQRREYLIINDQKGCMSSVDYGDLQWQFKSLNLETRKRVHLNTLQLSLCWKGLSECLFYFYFF